MDSPIDMLKSLNRKERFFLVGMALGNEDFRLSDEFRRTLSARLKLNGIPASCFAAMDYHLDWLFAALCTVDNQGDKPVENDGNILATQEDVDFLIAFEEGGKCHIIMLEAKGEMSWNNRQMQSKVQRIKAILEKAKEKRPNVSPHFILVSPRPPRKLTTDGWPDWMKPDGEVCWIRLQMPEGRKRVTRCDASGTPDREGTYWRIVGRVPRRIGGAIRQQSRGIYRGN
jgi:hypothetical protein